MGDLEHRRQSLKMLRGGFDREKPLQTRRYEVPWSFQSHPRLPLCRQRLALVLLMALKREGSAMAVLPKAVWINWILPFT